MSTNELAEQSAIYAQRIMDADKLLKRAAERLQDYCAQIDPELNDSLALEIRRFLGEP